MDSTPLIGPLLGVMEAGWTGFDLPSLLVMVGCDQSRPAHWNPAVSHSSMLKPAPHSTSTLYRINLLYLQSDRRP
ncbi:unnamed protein product [Arctogadus glacialis]